MTRITPRIIALERAFAPDATAIREASWSVQWALEAPTLDPDTKAWCKRIKRNHDQVDEAGWVRAIELALTRLGLPPAEIPELAGLGLMRVMLAAAAGAVEEPDA